MVHSFRLTGVPRESAVAMQAFNKAEMDRGGNRHYVSTPTPSITPHTFQFCEVLQVTPSTISRDTCTIDFAAHDSKGESIPLSTLSLSSSSATSSPLTLLRVIERVVYTVGKCHKHGVPLVGWSRRLHVLVPTWSATTTTTMPPPCVYLLPPDIRPDTEASLARDVQVLARWGLHLLDQCSHPVIPQSRELVTAKTLLSLVSTPTSNDDDVLSATGLLRELRALIASSSPSSSSRSPSPSYPHPTTSSSTCRPSIYSKSSSVGGVSPSPPVPLQNRSPEGVHDTEVVVCQPTHVLDDTCVYIDQQTHDEENEEDEDFNHGDNGCEESDDCGDISDIDVLETTTTPTPTAPIRGSLRRSSSVVGHAAQTKKPHRPKVWVPSIDELTHMLGSELVRAGNGCGSTSAPDGPLPPLQVASLTPLNIYTTAATSQINDDGAVVPDAADHHYGSMSQLDLREGVERRTMLKLAKLRGHMSMEGGDHVPFLQAAMVHTFSCIRTLERYIHPTPNTTTSIINLQFRPLLDRVAVLPNHGINEVLLWHATSSPIAAQAIRNEGFDCRLEGAAHGHRFGQGTYFTDCCAKALEYAGTCADGGASCALHKVGRKGKSSALISNKCATTTSSSSSSSPPCSDGYHHLFLCSVVLGAPHVAKGPCPTMRRPPPITITSTKSTTIATTDALYHDSVVGYGKAPPPTTKSPLSNGTGVFEQHAHREYVVFERGYAIPLLELRIKCTPSN